MKINVLDVYSLNKTSVVLLDSFTYPFMKGMILTDSSGKSHQIIEVGIIKSSDAEPKAELLVSGKVTAEYLELKPTVLSFPIMDQTHELLEM
ncbi:MAG: hypothetical protein LBV19_07635 [Streptococcaceae bacterium]|jgi:hypothetical protein|nr:hypothetical protein [Streptococcaceae bacterium]